MVEKEKKNSQPSELQQSLHMTVDVTKDTIGRIADGLVKESSRSTQYLQNYSLQMLQLYSDAVDDTIESQKQIYNALPRQLRIGFDIF